MAKVLMKGNEAIGAAAIKAGCKFFFGYPITPQSELPEYLSRELPKIGGCFLQAESEVAAINMVYGAAGSGARVMTSSSSPGIALKQEGISYIAGAELPCVIVDMMRGGPGLGSIQPAQSDYYIATRGGGNGDYHTISFAPASIQEMVDLVIEGFDIADMYRNPVFIAGDGMIGQMMEPVEFKEPKKRDLPPKTWAAAGRGKRKENNIKNEVRYETYGIEDAEIVFSAYGTTSRVCKSAIELLEKEGIKAGIVRPISIWPYPYEAFKKINPDCKDVLVVEMNHGQMVEDVTLGVEGRQKVHFYGRYGGMVPTVEEVAEEAKKILEARK